MMRKIDGLVLVLLMSVTAVSEASDEAVFGDGPYLGQKPPGGQTVFFTGPDPGNDNRGRIFWVSSRVIEASRGGE